MDDIKIELVRGLIIGMVIANLGWLVGMKHMQNDAIEHGVGAFVIDRHGSRPTFRWTTPRVVLNSK